MKVIGIAGPRFAYRLSSTSLWDHSSQVLTRELVGVWWPSWFDWKQTHLCILPGQKYYRFNQVSSWNAPVTERVHVWARNNLRNIQPPGAVSGFVLLFCLVVFFVFVCFALNAPAIVSSGESFPWRKNKKRIFEAVKKSFLVPFMLPLSSLSSTFL